MVRIRVVSAELASREERREGESVREPMLLKMSHRPHYQPQSGSSRLHHSQQLQHHPQPHPTVRQTRKGRWTSAEDLRLLESIRARGASSWKAVGEDVRTRSGDQCWKRWNDSLDPSLKHDPWTPAEDEMLETAVTSMGRCWSKIAAEVLGGRSGLACKNRMDHLERRRRRAATFCRQQQQHQHDQLQRQHMQYFQHQQQHEYLQHHLATGLTNLPAIGASLFRRGFTVPSSSPSSSVAATAQMGFNDTQTMTNHRSGIGAMSASFFRRENPSSVYSTASSGGVEGSVSSNSTNLSRWHQQSFSSSSEGLESTPLSWSESNRPLLHANDPVYDNVAKDAGSQYGLFRRAVSSAGVTSDQAKLLPWTSGVYDNVSMSSPLKTVELTSTAANTLPLFAQIHHHGHMSSQGIHNPAYGHDTSSGAPNGQGNVGVGGYGTNFVSEPTALQHASNRLAQYSPETQTSSDSAQHLSNTWLPAGFEHSASLTQSQPLRSNEMSVDNAPEAQTIHLSQFNQAFGIKSRGPVDQHSTLCTFNSNEDCSSGLAQVQGQKQQQHDGSPSSSSVALRESEYTATRMGVDDVPVGSMAGPPNPTAATSDITSTSPLRPQVELATSISGGYPIASRDARDDSVGQKVSQEQVSTPPRLEPPKKCRMTAEGDYLQESDPRTIDVLHLSSLRRLGSAQRRHEIIDRLELGHDPETSKSVLTPPHRDHFAESDVPAGHFASISMPSHHHCTHPLPYRSGGRAGNIWFSERSSIEVPRPTIECQEAKIKQEADETWDQHARHVISQSSQRQSTTSQTSEPRSYELFGQDPAMLKDTTSMQREESLLDHHQSDGDNSRYIEGSAHSSHSRRLSTLCTMPISNLDPQLTSRAGKTALSTVDCDRIQENKETSQRQANIAPSLSFDEHSLAMLRSSSRASLSSKGQKVI